jgi:hypothetical protein
MRFIFVLMLELINPLTGAPQRIKGCRMGMGFV